ncbi:TPA: amylo-alpha-1,6-glucosidase, partial [Burkholderia vietnamiensis]|nr:amylo-alpha-1,6-glucosidase [Burkholderia vietnamiensis]
CGFPRRRGEPPTAYPVACLPQAWAAGAPFMMLQACLGVSVDASRLEVRVERPALPEGVDWLRIDELRVGDETVSLMFRRVDGQVVAAAERSGRVKVVAVL